MNRFHTCLVVGLGLCCTACSRGAGGPAAAAGGNRSGDEAPPLEIRFRPAQGLRAKDGEVSCSVPEGRERVYDPETGVYHVHFNARNFTASGFEVTKAAARFPRPVVFRLTGVPSMYGCVGTPLALTVGDERYPMVDVGHDSFHAYDRFDRGLFRVEREEEVVTVAFTENGQALLKPGARIGFEIDTGW